MPSPKVKFGVILSNFGVTYMTYHWKISGSCYGSHHLLNSCYDRLKNRAFTLLKDIIFKASFKSLSGINFK